MGISYFRLLPCSPSPEVMEAYEGETSFVSVNSHTFSPLIPICANGVMERSIQQASVAELQTRYKGCGVLKEEDQHLEQH